MATYLLDTNHAGRLLDPRDPIWARGRNHLAAGDELAVTLGVVAEIQYGISATQDPAARELRQRRLTQILPQLRILELDLPAALEAGRIRGNLRRAGRQLDAIDAHLAALAILNDCILVTDDADFAPLAADLRLENWVGS